MHHLISMEEMIKSVHAFRFGPDDMFGGTAYLFNTEKGGGYFKMFGGCEELKSALTSTEFQEIAGTWFLCEYTKGLWKKRPEDVQNPGLERRWLIFWAVGESIRVIYKQKDVALEEDIHRLANPFWLDEQDHKGDHYRNTIRKHFDLATKVLKKVYLEAAKSEEFSHRNWFRAASTLTAATIELEGYSDFTSQLLDQYMFSKASGNR